MTKFILLFCFLSSTYCYAQSLSESQRAEILEAHNIERAQVGVPPLEWEEQLEASASEWADYLVSHGVFQHSTIEQRGESGENLWQGTSGYFPLKQMVGFWAGEKAYYVYGKLTAKRQKKETGHYTQMIWSTTQKMGCALKKSQDGKLDILVCHYTPVGNIVGSFPY